MAKNGIPVHRAKRCVHNTEVHAGSSPNGYQPQKANSKCVEDQSFLNQHNSSKLDDFIIDFSNIHISNRIEKFPLEKVGFKLAHNINRKELDIKGKREKILLAEQHAAQARRAISIRAARDRKAARLSLIGVEENPGPTMHAQLSAMSRVYQMTTGDTIHCRGWTSSPLLYQNLLTALSFDTFNDYMVLTGTCPFCNGDLLLPPPDLTREGVEKNPGPVRMMHCMFSTTPISTLNTCERVRPHYRPTILVGPARRLAEKKKRELGAKPPEERKTTVTRCTECKEEYGEDCIGSHYHLPPPGFHKCKIKLCCFDVEVDTADHTAPFPPIGVAHAHKGTPCNKFHGTHSEVKDCPIESDVEDSEDSFTDTDSDSSSPNVPWNDEEFASAYAAFLSAPPVAPTEKRKRSPIDPPPMKPVHKRGAIIPPTDLEAPPIIRPILKREVIVSPTPVESDPIVAVTPPLESPISDEGDGKSHCSTHISTEPIAAHESEPDESDSESDGGGGVPRLNLYQRIRARFDKTYQPVVAYDSDDDHPENLHMNTTSCNRIRDKFKKKFSTPPAGDEAIEMEDFARTVKSDPIDRPKFKRDIIKKDPRNATRLESLARAYLNNKAANRMLTADDQTALAAEYTGGITGEARKYLSTIDSSVMLRAYAHTVITPYGVLPFCFYCTVYITLDKQSYFDSFLKILRVKRGVSEKTQYSGIFAGGAQKYKFFEDFSVGQAHVERTYNLPKMLEFKHTMDVIVDSRVLTFLKNTPSSVLTATLNGSAAAANSTYTRVYRHAMGSFPPNLHGSSTCDIIGGTVLLFLQENLFRKTVVLSTTPLVDTNTIGKKLFYQNFP